MTDGLSYPELCVPAVSHQPALILRPWRVADIPALIAEMSRDYLLGGMWSRPGERPFRTVLCGGAERTGPMGERDAARWVASQDRGWRDGDRLSFAVLEADDAGGCVLAGNVGLKIVRRPAGSASARPPRSATGPRWRWDKPAADHARASKRCLWRAKNSYLAKETVS